MQGVCDAIIVTTTLRAVERVNLNLIEPWSRMYVVNASITLDPMVVPIAKPNTHK